MTIQEKLSSLKPFVKSMRFYEDFPVIDATFKDKWKIPTGKKIKSFLDDKNQQYTFYSEDKRIGFDELLEYVEEIIKMNIDLEKKQELYKIKNRELKELFLESTNKYEDLIKLEFIIPERVSTDEDEEINLFTGTEELEKEKNNKVVERSIVETTKEVDKIIPPNPKLVELPPKEMVVEKVIVTEDEPPLAEVTQPRYEI